MSEYNMDSEKLLDNSFESIGNEKDSVKSPMNNERNTEKINLFDLLEIFFKTEGTTGNKSNIYDAFNAAKASGSHDTYTELLGRLAQSPFKPGFIVDSVPVGASFAYKVQFLGGENQSHVSNYTSAPDNPPSHEPHQKNTLSRVERPVSDDHLNHANSIIEDISRNAKRIDTYDKKIDNQNKKIGTHDEKIDNHEKKIYYYGADIESLREEIHRLRFANAEDKRSTTEQSFISFVQDAFSFIMVRPRSFPAISAFFIFLVQLAAYFLAVENKVFVEKEDSEFSESPPFDLPVGVGQSVHAGQGIALFITVLVQESMWETVADLSNGYNEHLKGQNIKFIWWLIPNVLRILGSIVALFVTFILVITSDSTVELFKDLTAMLFVSSFDNVLFVMAQLNALGHTFKIVADEVEGVTYKVTSSLSKQKYRNLSHGSYFMKVITKWLLKPYMIALVLLVIVYTLWIRLLLMPHLHGGYLCQNIYIQLDDNVNPDLSFFSGRYELLKNADKRGLYPAYKEQKRSLESFKDSNPMILRYCESMGSWVFVLQNKKYEDECQEENILAMSSDAEAQAQYNVFEVYEDEWQAKYEDGRFMPFDDLFMHCTDKYSKEESQKYHSSLCQEVEIDTRFEEFESSRSWSKHFTMLTDEMDDSKFITVHDHFVYASGDKQDLLFFTGKRWVVTSAQDLFDLTPNDDLRSYLENDFHGMWSKFKVTFISEPVKLDTPEDTGTPISLKWNSATPKVDDETQVADPNRELTTSLLCSNCNNDTNPCYFEGVCLDDKTCHCATGSTGTLCQITPTTNGFCDIYFNSKEYNYDGGDCCEHTCVSSETFQCGRDRSGLFYVGYDSCHVDTCADCWRESVKSPNMKDLIVADMSLSSSGRVLGLVEFVGKTARVYDNDGSSWVMRGSAIMTIDEPSSSMIQVMGCEDQLNSGTFYTPMTVAIKTDEKVHVFDWNMTVWSEHDSSIFNSVSSPPMKLELKNNGNSLGVLYENDFKLFERDHSSSYWKDIIFELNKSGKYRFLSLSKNAKKVILATDTCAEMYDLVDNVTNATCNLQNSRAIKQIALSSNGQKLGMLLERGSQGEVVVYHVENNTFFERGNKLRGVLVQNAKIEVSNDGATVASYSDVSNVVVMHEFRNNQWQMTESIPSKSLALSSNQKVMATISPSFGSPVVFHRNAFCEEGFSNVRLSFITDDHPNELMWEILNITASGDVSTLKKGGPYESAQSTFVDELCIDDNVISNADLDSAYCIGLRVVDLGRDGLKSPGKIGISINGTIILTMDETDGYDNIYRIVGYMDCLRLVKEDLPWPVKYNPSLHTECLTVECKWNLIGSVNRPSDYFDHDKPLGMSADGLIISIGDWRKDQVQMLQYNKNSGWAPHGANNIIMGQDDNIRFGFSTSLSADGSIVAIGATWSNANGDNSGQVRVYAFNEIDKNWSQYGNAVNGSFANDHFGDTVSLSADGSIFAAGVHNDDRFGCAAYVYEFISTTEEWLPKGGCIGDESFRAMVKVKLSSIGSLVVLGYHLVDDWDGAVQVYKYNIIHKEWIQLGNDFGEGFRLGWSVAISSNELILAVTGETCCLAKTYKFDTDENDWRQMGQNIVGDAGCRSFFDTSLSSDGLVLVLSYCGTVQVLTYDKTTNEWKDSITNFPTVDFNYEFQATASSADAITVARKIDTSVQIFHLAKSTVSNNTCDGTVFHFTIQPDRFPGDIEWFLQDQAGQVVIGGKLPNDDIDRQSKFNYSKCLPHNSTTFYFYIEDEYGDGICCDWGVGHFTVKWDNETVMDDNDFKSHKSICLPDSSNLILMSIQISNFNRFSTLEVSDSNENILLSRSRFDNVDENITFYQCIPSNECIKIALLSIDTVSVYFNDSLNHTFVSTEDLEIFHVGDCDMQSCLQNHSFFEMYFATDWYPEKFSWELLDSNNDILMSGDDYDIVFNIHHYHGCVATSPPDCVTLLFYFNHYAHGFPYHHVTWNGNTISSGYRGNLGLRMCNKQCPEGMRHVDFSFVTDLYPSEFSWNVINGNGNIMMSGGNYTKAYSRYYISDCVSVTENSCLTFQAFDTADNGGTVYQLNEGQNYDVFHQGNANKHVTKVPFPVTDNCTSCSQGESLFELEMFIRNAGIQFSWDLVDANNSIITSGSQYKDQYKQYNHRECMSVVTSNECLVLRFHVWVPLEAVDYTVKLDGNVIKSSQTALTPFDEVVLSGNCAVPICQQGYMNIAVGLQTIKCASDGTCYTHPNPDSFSFEVVDSSNRTVLNGGHLKNDPYQLVYYYRTCVPSYECLRFRFLESSYDGVVWLWYYENGIYKKFFGKDANSGGGEEYQLC